jgi:hypothetical protein
VLIRRPLALLPATSPASWRYTGGARDERLDLLRGFAVFAMVVDHIGGNASWLYSITGGDHFVVSAAESFVLIAGLTMGMVYARLIAARGPGAAVRKALHRSATLYALTIALTVAFAGASALLAAPWAPVVASGGWLRWFADVVTLGRTFYLTDIILMYTIIVAAAAPLFILLARGHARAVLLGSWLLWGLWQLAPGDVYVPWRIADNDMFTIAAWQVIFVTGIVVGYYRRSIEQRLARLTPLTVAAASGAAVVAVLLLLALAPHPAGAPHSVGGMVVSELGRKSDVPFARLAMLALLFTFAYSTATVGWRPLTRWTRWLLMPLGQHALFAYVTHLGVIICLGSLLPTWNVARTPAETALIQATGVLLVWSAVVLHQPVRRLVMAAREALAVRTIESRSPARALDLIPERAD